MKQVIRPIVACSVAGGGGTAIGLIYCATNHIRHFTGTQFLVMCLLGLGWGIFCVLLFHLIETFRGE